MKPFVKNAADEKQVKEAKRQSKFSREQELDDVRQLLKLPAGRRFLWRFLERCGVYKSSYDPSGSRVYFNEGERNIGIMLLAEITQADPESYVSMMLESERQKFQQQNEKEKDTKEEDNG